MWRSGRSHTLHGGVNYKTSLGKFHLATNIEGAPPNARHCGGHQVDSGERETQSPWSHGAHILKTLNTHNTLTQNFTSLCPSWRNTRNTHNIYYKNVCCSIICKIVSHQENLNVHQQEND